MSRNFTRIALVVLLAAAGFAQSAGVGAGDPILMAMRAEMERSTTKLQLANMPRPYFVEYRLLDDDSYLSEAAFGATRWEQHSHQRFLRVTVRVGDYKQDSSTGAAEGVQDLAPMEDNVPALRHRIWLATDAAYKNAIESLARKQAQLKQFESDQALPDDFSHEKPALNIMPLAKLEYDAVHWRAALKAATAVYRADPDLQAFNARLTFHVQNKYVVNSEGTILRQPESIYSVSIAAATQAPDGRRIDRGYTRVVTTPKELPTEDDLRTAAQKVIANVEGMKKAPLVEDQYRGPVLLAPDASATALARLIGTAVLGRRPRPGTTTRTIGDFATSWKSRVLPDFMDIIDDPTIERAAGRTLVGTYKYDDDGVEARPVKLIEHGTLLNFLVGRQPIRDFPASSGHSRVAGPQGVAISLGNMFVTSSAPVSFDDLKKRLIEICKQRELPYGYLAEGMSAARPEPLYRIYVKDGHQELVRGGEFAQFDTRALRSNLIAAGDDAIVNNLLDGAPHSIIAPSMLFDELEIRKSAAGRDKLPDYPPPAFGRKN